MLDCLGARTIEVSRGETVFLEGDPAEDIGILLSGAVQIVRNDYSGNRSASGRRRAFGIVWRGICLRASPGHTGERSRCLRQRDSAGGLQKDTSRLRQYLQVSYAADPASSAYRS